MNNYSFSLLDWEKQQALVDHINKRNKEILNRMARRWLNQKVHIVFKAWCGYVQANKALKIKFAKLQSRGQKLNLLTVFRAWKDSIKEFQLERENEGQYQNELHLRSLTKDKGIALKYIEQLLQDIDSKEKVIFFFYNHV